MAGTRPRLSDAEADLIVQGAELPDDRIALFLLRHTGIRVSELTNLEIGQIDTRNNTITIKHLKQRRKVVCPVCGTRLSRTNVFCPGCTLRVSEPLRTEVTENSERVLDVPKSVMAEIQEYLETYHAKSSPDTKLYPFSRWTVAKMLRTATVKALGSDDKILKAPGMKRAHHVSPHAFRAAVISRIIDKVPGPEGVKFAQEYAGHKMSTTTMNYFRLLPERTQAILSQVWDEKKPKKPRKKAG